MSLPGVLQHLQVLEASGLIESEKVGRAPGRLGDYLDTHPATGRDRTSDDENHPT